MQTLWVINTFSRCVWQCPNLIRLSLQVFRVTPVSPYIPHTPLSGPLQQRAANQQWAHILEDGCQSYAADGYLPCSAVSERAGRPQACLCLPCAWSGPPPLDDYRLLALREKRARHKKRSPIFFIKDLFIKECHRRLTEVTAVEVDGPNQLQVGVYSPNAVDVSTILQSRADWCLIQVLGLALQPGEEGKKKY